MLVAIKMWPLFSVIGILNDINTSKTKSSGFGE